MLHRVRSGFLLLSVASLSATGLLGGCAHVSPLATFEQKVVYQPLPYPQGNWSFGGAEFEDAWFSAKDGTRIHGWFSPHPNPRAVALFCHGNAGNLSHRSHTLRVLRDRHDVAVLIFDYRGYGRSEGTPSESGLIQDAKAARAWLAHRTSVRESDITLMGRSLGGGVAVQLAVDDGARGLILAITFTSLPDVGREHAPFLIPRLVMRNRFDSIHRIVEYAGPLLISHGGADELIPFEHGRKLFAAATGPKQFVPIHGAGHNDPQSEEYREEFDRFLAHLPAMSSPPQL